MRKNAAFVKTDNSAAAYHQAAHSMSTNHREELLGKKFSDPEVVHATIRSRSRNDKFHKTFNVLSLHCEMS